ncbi:TadE/TadG family type IV pilus assembly protein, partial [Sphingomonas sp.]|uniref:TadE/TadG family type IV pilus assembly protein n=1 Tax=Sphingomonas sp. TaxID=28214 RepID=UPI0035C83CC6
MTIVEFGIILLPLLAVIFGLFELGYQAYIKSIAAGALETAIRNVSIGNKSQSDISTKLKDDLGVIVDRKYVAVDVQSFVNFDAVGSPEKLTDDKNGNGQYDAGDCFRDANDNGR